MVVQNEAVEARRRLALLDTMMVGCYPGYRVCLVPHSIGGWGVSIILHAVACMKKGRREIRFRKNSI